MSAPPGMGGALIEEAVKIAQAEKKLVFWYHVAGDLDKEGC